jgi:hypothetical protein
MAAKLTNYVVWKNFIHGVWNAAYSRVAPDEFSAVTTSVIQEELLKELQQYGGRYNYSDKTYNLYIEFETEEQLTYFLLKWS